VAEGNYSRIGIARVGFDDVGDPISVERLGIALEPTEPFEKLHRTNVSDLDDRILMTAHRDLARLRPWLSLTGALMQGDDAGNAATSGGGGAPHLGAARALKTCPVCGTSFRASARQIYDKPTCGQKAAHVRHADERRATRSERYRRHLRLGGSSTPLV
jgi:hypothetical protein